MNNKFSNIMDIHEIEDSMAEVEEAKLYAIINNLFSNPEEVICFIKNTLRVSPSEYNSFERMDFSDKMIPIRTECEFRIRKHTNTQIPYFHAHDFYEIIAVIKGRCVQHVGMEKLLVIMNEGDICILPPSVSHILEKPCKSDIVLKMHIPKSIFDNARGKSEFGEYKMYNNISKQSEYFVLKLLSECDEAQDNFDICIIHYLALLLIEISRTKEVKFNKIVAELNKYVRENIKSAMLSQFSKSIGYSSVYVGKVIKENTGKSFTAYLTDIKMSTVVEQLINTNNTIDDIASSVGYADASGLHKQFLITYGMTPTAYRINFS